jgi:hypothetical protein
MSNAELLVKYGEWYMKTQITVSDKKKQECLCYSIEFGREIIRRMERGNNEKRRKN